MIYFYSGTPGSGKSFHVAKKIYSRLFQDKKHVIANFDINRDIYDSKKKKGTFEYYSNFDLSPEFFINHAKERYSKNGTIKEGEVLVIIDECQILFNPRHWQDKSRIKWIEFFSQHRKFGYDFILVSQNDKLVDKQIRCLFEYEVKHRKANNFKAFKMLPFPVFCAINCWYGVREKVDSEFIFFNKKYANMYNTFKDFNDDYVVG